jgi:hypothetical protein
MQCCCACACVMRKCTVSVCCRIVRLPLGGTVSQQTRTWSAHWCIYRHAEVSGVRSGVCCVFVVRRRVCAMGLSSTQVLTDRHPSVEGVCACECGCGCGLGGGVTQQTWCARSGGGGATSRAGAGRRGGGGQHVCCCAVMPGTAVNGPTLGRVFVLRSRLSLLRVVAQHGVWLMWLLCIASVCVGASECVQCAVSVPVWHSHA